MKNLTNFINLFPKRQKYLIFLVFFSTFVISGIETISLGSLAGYVMILSDTQSFINKIPIDSVKNYVAVLTDDQFVVYSSILLIFIFIIKNLIMLLFNYVNIRVEKNILINLSNRLLDSYLSRTYLFHISNNPNNLINSILAETARGLAFIFTIINLTRECLVLIILFIAIIFVNYGLAVLVILSMGIASSIFFFTVKNLLKKLGLDHKIVSEIRLKNLSEIFGIVKLIKLFNAKEYFVNQFNKINVKKLNIDNKIRFITLIPRAFLEVAAIFTISFTSFYFIFYSYDIKTAIPTLSLLAILLVRAIPAFGTINISASVLQYHKQSMMFIVKEFMNHETLKKNYEINDNFIRNEKIETIYLKNISFKFQNSDKIILNGVDLKLKKNQIIGIIGESGSGKSTLIDIILGLLSPFDGEVIINGSSKFRLFEKNNQNIGYVPQDVYLTDDTIKNNVALGLNEKLINEKKILKIFEILKLDNILSQSNEGIETKVGNRGIKLSGGQRQRIGIARALYKDLEILILDEATNALDIDTEKYIIEQINNLRADKIIIMINHRANMLPACDKIYVMKNGSIIESGKLKELSSKNLIDLK